MVFFILLLVIGNILVGVATAVLSPLLSIYVLQDYNSFWSVLITASSLALVTNISILAYFGYFSKSENIKDITGKEE